MALRDEPLLIFDGACGTTLQQLDLAPEAWDGKDGCNEYLNLSAPEAIQEMHRRFLEAGAQVLETNTFGASGVVLAEYGLEGEVEAINAAAVAHARAAIGDRPGRYVAGSVGPTTKLPGLGHISVEALAATYREQIRALVEAGVDAILLETCQDLLQAKTGVVAAFEVLEALGRDVPVLVSLTVETTGTLLTGADIAAAATALEPFPLFSLGLNCATGPEHMASHVRWLARHWPGRISVIPNAGIPSVVLGQTHYPLTPEGFAAAQRRFVVEEGASVVGGCCGTTPEHIHALVAALDGVRPGAREPQWEPALSSAYQAVAMTQSPPPLLIGERANANGSKAFRERLLADDFEGALKIGASQASEGAHAVDLCTAYAGRDEEADLAVLIRLFAETVTLPTVIDSTTPAAVAACLAAHPGRCLVNSINLEDGGANLDRLCRLARRHGAAVVALTIHEQGMAMTTDDKVATARAIYDRAVGEHGLRPEDLFYDPLTFTIGAGDATLRDAGIQTLEAIRRIKAELPGVHTVLGVSNISFGLGRRSRRVLNSVFLHEAVKAGLDAAIIDAGKILPLALVEAADREVCLDLIYDRRKGEEHDPLTTFIDHFAALTGESGRGAVAGDEVEQREEQRLADRVVGGDREGVEDLLDILLGRRTPVAIINELLVPAMRHVGELFGRGEMLLPFVLQSAEVMKRCVAYLEPHMEKSERRAGKKVLLATVQGDVHDIGKNLVDIILSNNGYQVFNLGIKVPAETILDQARALEVDVIGLSGLLVKSALVMRETLPQLREAGLRVPVLLGGAALTPKFVAEECVVGYDGPVVYCADAFAGLRAMRELEAGTLASTTWDVATAVTPMKPGPKASEVRRDVPAPAPPFLGARHRTDLDPALLFPYVNAQALFRGRWGYRRAKLGRDEYAALIRDQVRPEYEALKVRAVAEGLITPRVAWGWFAAHGDGEQVVVTDAEREHVFPFPRQAEPPHLCIADYFRPAADGGDVAGFFVVTIGERISEAARELYEADRYHDYLLLHGFGVEVTDALAEYWHEHMRRELGFDGARPADMTGYVAQEYRGSRYGFGYPACPDLEAQRPVFALLCPEAIGVTLTETLEMVPEQSTSAIVVHHPQAKYFAV